MMAARENRARFAVCISNDGCADLEVNKLYRVMPDRLAEKEGHLRIIDESGEDYLYHADRFVIVDVTASFTKSP
jgi:hypothetical protein